MNRATTHVLPDLEDLLLFENEDVLFSFEQRFNFPRDESREIFCEMLRYLWLSTKLRLEGSPVKVEIDAALRVIDEMWHAFILHTAAYSDFCDRYFGQFLHHQPTTSQARDRFQTELDAVAVEQRIAWLTARKRQRYELVYDHLGDVTFRKWYVDFAKRYDARALQQRRIR